MVRLALAMYPKAVRERYGEEIAELLTESSRPARDLADVAWCALIEQGSLMSVPQSRSRVPRAAGVLVVPLVLGVALLIAASVSILVVATIDGGASQAVVASVTALGVVPVIAAAAWLGWRVSREPSMSRWLWIVPALLASGILALSSVPIVGEALGEARLAVAAATVSWGLLLTALVMVVARLTPRLPWSFVLLAMVIAGITVLDLTFVAYAAFDSTDGAPASYWWYPMTLAAYDFGSPGAAADLAEQLKGLPALLTTCTAFTLSLAGAIARRVPRTTPVPAVR